MGAKKAVAEEFLSTGTIARKMNVSLDTIRREIYSGRLKASRFNERSFIVAVSDFEEWKAKHISAVTDLTERSEVKRRGFEKKEERAKAKAASSDV